MRKLTLAISTAALVIAGAASAQTAPTLTRAAKPDMTRAQAQAKAEAAFARIDANRDGTVDQADRQARRGQMFERIDTDRNGSISRAEFDAMHANRGARDGKARADNRTGGDRMGARGAGGHRGMMMGKAAGPMTRQAFVNRALTMFDRADANRDGTVTQAERKAVRETMRQQWQAKRQQG